MIKVFFGIIIFIVVFYPFFAVNLRFQLGEIFQVIFDTIGFMCFAVGSVLLIFTLVNVFLGGRIKVGWMIAGIVLLWIGCWSTGAVLNLFGFTFGESTSSGGSGYY